MPGTWGHLFKRYREGILSSPLDPAEWDWVESFLADPERSAFREQPTADQRHGYRAARVAEAILGAHRSGIRAALLHDIGKRHARLGLVGRALVSVAIRLRVPLWERARIYRDHGPVGSEELSGWGAEPLVVEFARSHHGARPPSIEEAVWEALCETDKPH
ncbi:MAG: HDIG domain-containing protein [bacterium]|nr:HDIG domain-containing protein [bacterium]MDE0602098.1 HDIG domain-containing protein [bacterium]